MAQRVNDLELRAPLYRIEIAHSHEVILVTLHDDPTYCPPSTPSVLRDRLHRFKERHWSSLYGDIRNLWSPPQGTMLRFDNYKDTFGIEKKVHEAGETYRQYAKTMGTRVPGSREAYAMAMMGISGRLCVQYYNELQGNRKDVSFRFTLMKNRNKVEVAMFAIEGEKEIQVDCTVGKSFSLALDALEEKWIQKVMNRPRK